MIFGRGDSDTHVGNVRLFVHKWKKNPKDHWWDNGFHILACSVFQFGIISDKGEWLSEEIYESYASPIPDYLDDQPDGFYEMVGDVWYRSWRCGYEYEEYDAEWRIENLQIKRLTWEEAFHIEPEYELFEGNKALGGQRIFSDTILFAQQSDLVTYKKIYDHLRKQFKHKNIPGLVADYEGTDRPEYYVKWFDDLVVNDLTSDFKLNKFELKSLEPISEFLIERELFLKEEIDE